jgi:L-alanine-DL-glutamate epimerase-like enolase superfamily enzyme
VLTVEDADGAAGRCLIQPDHLRPHILDNHVRPLLLGRDAADRELLWTELARRQRGAGGAFTDRGLGFVDQALWDLAGRRAGLPVWKLIGGARSRVPAYASTMCGDRIPGGLADPADYAAFAKSLVDRGYRAIKLHTWMPPVPGAPSVARDIEACAAVRDAVGPDVELMLDANHWYRRTEALALGRALQQLGYTWFEEPMEEASICSYRWLAAQLDIPVIGPESAGGKHWTRAEWAVTGACDILRTGVTDVGGITPALKTLHLAEALNLDCEVHGGGTGNLALVGASAASRWYERGLLHPHTDYERLPPHLASLPDPMGEDGYVALPRTPGLGDDLDLAYIEAHATARWGR